MTFRWQIGREADPHSSFGGVLYNGLVLEGVALAMNRVRDLSLPMY